MAALIAIKPHFADAILSGAKRVEFRKVLFRRKVTHIVLYVSRPVSRIVAVVGVDGLYHDAPREIWQRCADVGGIHEQEFLDYFAGSESAVAIRLARVAKLPEQICLADLLPGRRAPQGFYYLSDEAFARTLALANG